MTASVTLAHVLGIINVRFIDIARICRLFIGEKDSLPDR
jgi:hypothetical protein